MSAEKQKLLYSGFEQGPIRPPSEAASLLIRVSRNCPWNHCTFCPVYKGAKFSLRPAEHVMMDVDTVAGHLAVIFKLAQEPTGLTHEALAKEMEGLPPGERAAFAAAVNWYANGMESIFLQDANSLVIKPQDLISLLRHIKSRFPWVKRITSYARSHTVARISAGHLAQMAQAGLNRIHIGMESGSDKVLEKVCKGTTKEQHIKAGQKVKAAGIELSEYVMPGLGGVELSREHALETADALNQIDPEFIRLRSLVVPPGAPLFDSFSSGKFKILPDVEVAREILLFLESLEGISSTVASDHILNLFEDVKGKLPQDKEAMTGIIRRFLALSPQKRTVYQVGRRMGLFRSLDDIENPALASRAESVIKENNITPENVDATLYELLSRFI